MHKIHFIEFNIVSISILFRLDGPEFVSIKACTVINASCTNIPEWTWTFTRILHLYEFLWIIRNEQIHNLAYFTIWIVVSKSGSNKLAWSLNFFWKIICQVQHLGTLPSRYSSGTQNGHFTVCIRGRMDIFAWFRSDYRKVLTSSLA